MPTPADRSPLRAGFEKLADPSFARLFSARLISAFGSQVALIAIAFGVLGLTGSSAQMALVMGSQTTMQVLMTLFGGALADRWSRKRMLVFGELLAGSSQAIVAVLLLTETAQVWQLMLLMGVNGVAFGLLFPAAVGLVPLVVERDELQSANALIALAQSAAFSLGGGAAAWLVGTAGGGSNVIGAGWAITVDAATFFLAGGLVSGIVARAQVRDEAAAGSSLLRDLREGWREFVSHRWLWTIVTQWSLVLMGYLAGLNIIGPFVADQSLGGPEAWGMVVVALGIGLVLGGLAGMLLRVRRPMLVGSISVFAFALPLCGLATGAGVPFLAAGALLAGFGGELFAVLWYTALHTHVAPDKLSRVAAYDQLGSVALAPIGEIGAGFLIGVIGAATTAWIAVGLVVIPTILVLLVPEVRRLPSVTPKFEGEGA